MKYRNLFLKVQDEDDLLFITLNCPIANIKNCSRKVLPPISRKLLGGFVGGIEKIAERSNPSDQDWLEKQGLLIYSKLFSEEWRKYWQQALSICRSQGFGLRISFDARGELAEGTPWELLYDPISEQFVSCSHDCVIVRSPYCEEDRDISVSDFPIRVLAASASPPRYSSVHSDLEIGAIKECLNLLPNYAISFSEASRVSWDELVGSLQATNPHVLHLVAHGNERGVFFEDDCNVDYRTLIRQISATQSLRVLIMSGCNSKYLLHHRSLLDEQSSLPSTHSVWALIVTGATISSAASLSFVKFLYRSLAIHNSLTYAVGCARNSLAGSNTLESMQWSIPVLHDTCDVIVFPPIRELHQLADISSFHLDQIFRLQQKVDEAESKISELRKWLDDYPDLDSAFFCMMNNQPRQVEAEIIRDITEILSNVHVYPNHLVIWINTTRNMAASTYELFNKCSNKIDDLAKTKGHISSRKLQSIKKVSKDAHNRIGELKEKFEQLLHTP